MNARTIILIAGVGMTLGCGRFFVSEPVRKNPPPPPPTGNPPGPTDSAEPPTINPPGPADRVEEDPEAKKSAVDGALEEGGE